MKRWSRETHVEAPSYEWGFELSCTNSSQLHKLTLSSIWENTSCWSNTSLASSPKRSCRPLGASLSRYGTYICILSKVGSSSTSLRRSLSTVHSSYAGKVPERVRQRAESRSWKWAKRRRYTQFESTTAVRRGAADGRHRSRSPSAT